LRPPDFYAHPVCSRTGDDPTSCEYHADPIKMEEIRMGDVGNPDLVPERDLYWVEYVEYKPAEG